MKWTTEAEAAVKKVPFFVYPDVYRDDAEGIQKIVADVGDRGAFILQKDVEELENSLSIAKLIFF